jgi:hypothetical protein
MSSVRFGGRSSVAAGSRSLLKALRTGLRLPRCQPTPPDRTASPTNPRARVPTRPVRVWIPPQIRNAAATVYTWAEREDVEALLDAGWLLAD